MRFRALLLFFLVLISFSLTCSADGECSSTSPCPGGECCSQYGYCGTTADYCCSDCQANCDQSVCDDSGGSDEGTCSSTSPCPGGECCSQFGYCGITSAHCCSGCQSNCDQSVCGGSDECDTGGTTTDPGELGKIISREMFEKMFLHKNDSACNGKCLFTYDGFIEAAQAFPEFANTGNDTMRKRELAAFFAQTGHETTGGAGDWNPPDGPYAWGYCFKQELNPSSDYCNYDYPCPLPGKYYGRGPIQLSYNYNYLWCGEALGVDLLNNPDLLITDPVLSFKSAIWFWMTEQSPKPSCHEVILDEWSPSQSDINAGRLPGFGLTTNIINGGLECGHGTDDRVEDRIGFFKNFTGTFGIEPGENLDCYTQQSWGSSLLTMVQSM